MRVSNNLDQGQARYFVWADLGPNACKGNQHRSSFDC